MLLYGLEVDIDDASFAVLLHADGGGVHDFYVIYLSCLQGGQHHILALSDADVVYLQGVAR